MREDLCLQLADLVEGGVQLGLGGVLDVIVIERGAGAERGEQGADGVLAVLGLDPAQAALGMVTAQSR